jgi:hypothetical protein
MAAELPYLASYKNVSELFQRIASAKKPEAFTQKYLADTLGLKSVADRQLITLLKTLGFLDSAARPTSDYDQLKNPTRARQAIGQAIRRAYEPLYAANERAHELSNSELKGLISQVAGSDSGQTGKILGTYGSLVKLAEFGRDESLQPDRGVSVSTHTDESLPPPSRKGPTMGHARPEFHFNIQVHLPANATEETYLNIFNALRKSFES